MDSLHKLIETLNTMVDAHSRLLEIAKEKRSILMDNNVQELQRVILRESTLVDEIERLEQTRKACVKEFMEQNGHSDLTFALEDIMKMEMDAVTKTVLQTKAKQLRLLIQEITQLTASNQQLLETSLSYVQYSIGLLVPKEQSFGYGPNAKKRHSNLLDAKI